MVNTIQIAAFNRSKYMKAPNLYNFSRNYQSFYRVTVGVNEILGSMTSATYFSMILYILKAKLWYVSTMK